MKIALQFVLILLIFNNCFSKVTSDFPENIGRFAALNRHFYKGTSDKNNVVTRKFIDLNTDVLIDIIDELNLTDFLTLVKTNSQLSFLAGNLFRRRYRQYTITILAANASGFHENHHDKQVEIYDLNSMIEIFKNFGQWIQRLNIQNHNISKDFSMTIDQMINRHCSESLTHLNLGLNEFTLEYFTRPFRKVEEITVSVRAKVVRSGILLFNRLFPKLRKMNLVLNSNIDYSFITFEYPHLDALSMVMSNDVWKRKERIEGLLRKNPQIQCIQIQYGPMDYVKDINAFLPNLQSLVLYTFDIGNGSLHFDHVDNFTLFTSSPHSIEKLSFARLKALQMEYSPMFFNEWLTFFQMHTNLSHLHLNDHYSAQIVPLMELTVGLSNLVEMVLECSASISVETITAFIRSHQKLKKLFFSFDEFVHEDIESVRKEFERDWYIRDYISSLSWVGLVFERIE